MVNITSSNLTMVNDTISGVVNEKKTVWDTMITFFTSPIGIILLIMVIGILILFFILRRLKHKKEFEFVSFARIIDDDFKKKFELKGLDVNGTLTQGFEFLGKVNKLIHEKANMDILYYDPKNDRFFRPKDKPLTRIYDLYLFRLDQKGFFLIRWLRNMLGIGKWPYVVVDSGNIENFGGPRAQMWNIKSQIAFQRFGEVFVTSEMGKDYLSDLATKYAHESELTYIANYPNKLIFLEMDHAKYVNRISSKKNIESRAYKEYKRGNEDVKEDDTED